MRQYVIFFRPKDEFWSYKGRIVKETYFTYTVSYKRTRFEVLKKWFKKNGVVRKTYKYQPYAAYEHARWLNKKPLKRLAKNAFWFNPIFFLVEKIKRLTKA